MKKTLIYILILALCISILSPSLVVQSKQDAEFYAESLNSLGLFRGVGENEDGSVNYDLNRPPTRVEALVMLIRALGMDNEAEFHAKTHPFVDVPVWADGYVSYAYENGLVRGVSSTRMDSQSPASLEHFLTFMLRGLGYVEGKWKDFVWNDPFALARYAAVLPDGMRDRAFLRSDITAVTTAALFAQQKNSLSLLNEKLISMGVFTKDQFEDVFMDNPFLELKDNGFTSVKYVEYGDYEEAMATVESMEVLQKFETKDVTIVSGLSEDSIDSSPYSLSLLYKKGSELGEGIHISLPVSTEAPADLVLSEDDTTLVYNYSFDAPLVAYGEDITRVLREAGTYRFVVNLKSGTVFVFTNTNAYDEWKASVDEVLDIVRNRKIVETSYMHYWEEDTVLMDMLAKYNDSTARYYDYFYNMASLTVTNIALGGDNRPEVEPSYPVSKEVFEEMVQRIADNSLYKDHTQRFMDDPLLRPMIEKELGGSAGMWALWWHTVYLDQDPNMKIALKEYFVLIADIEGYLEDSLK